MFKGLRTKIETERKIQSGTDCKIGPNLNSIVEKKTKQDSKSFNEQNLSPSSSTANPANDQSKFDRSETNSPNGSINTSLSHALQPNTQLSNTSAKGNHNSEEKAFDGNLQDQITRLNDQLKAVMKEKEECNDQNSQLYQLIEKLRRNLENEKEINSSLRLQLNDVEFKLKQAVEQPREGNRTTNISIRSFNQDGLPITSDVDGKSSDPDALRHEIIDLQAQLAKKNRLLKIRQQNLNDLKKTLQKEMLDHGKAQEELTRLQRQIKEQESRQADTSTQLHQNGTNHNDSGDFADTKPNHNQSVGNEIPSNPGQSSNQQATTAGGSVDDTISLSALGGTQLDRISYMSQSSASIDEFDSNDLHQSNYSRDVNHEYLKNVLFRYMTSTDTETTQHLVKALSVLMDFSPDQSAAIKNALHARTSWLRLK